MADHRLRDMKWALNSGKIPGPETALLAYRGSVSHGTYVPPYDEFSTDDVDLMGIMVPGDDCYLGLREYGSRGTVEIMDDPYDVVLYESRKAVGLLAKGNPNILNLLWLSEEHYLYSSDAGRELIGCRNLFRTKAAYMPYRGYARAQMQKMQAGAYQGYMGEKRKGLVDRFGYDTKNASHLIRLLRQGVEFLKDGDLIVDRRVAGDAAELIEIKQGLWDLESVKTQAFWLEDELRHTYEESKLPERPDDDLVNALAVRLYHIHREEFA